MDDTGLKDILGVVYGENSVIHMMTGKSVQRAFRGHLLVDRCLNRMLVSEMVHDNDEFAAMVEQSEVLYTSLVKGELPIETVFTSETLIKINEELGKGKWNCVPDLRPVSCG